MMQAPTLDQQFLSLATDYAKINSGNCCPKRSFGYLYFLPRHSNLQDLILKLSEQKTVLLLNLSMGHFRSFITINSCCCFLPTTR